MLRKHLIVFIILLLQSSGLFALPVVINGTSAAGNAYVFRLYVLQDPISGEESIVDQQRPDEQGHFMLGFEVKKIQKVSIKVGLQSMSFFVIPGKTYQLNFNEITLKDQNVFLPEHPLKVIFQDDDMLNAVIDGFEYDYQVFLEGNFIQVMKYRDRKLFSEFQDKIYQKLSESPLQDSMFKDFVKTYIRYRLAEVKMATKIEKKQSLGLEYLAHQPILLNNPAYAGFFKKYFMNYLLNLGSTEDYDHIQNLINDGAFSFSKLKDVLGKDPVLVEERFRELVLLYSLKQSFYKKNFIKESVNQMIDHVHQHSKFEENRKVAANLLLVLNRFLKGNSLPDFQLMNLSGVKKSLSDYKGKKTYLMFVTPTCETCEADIRILKNIMADYKDDLNIVTIYAGFNKEHAAIWANKLKVNWDFLWFNDDFNLLNQYLVKTFPKYLMLDEDGKLLYYFPPQPRENLLSYLKAVKEHETAADKSNKDASNELFHRK